MHDTTARVPGRTEGIPMDSPPPIPLRVMVAPCRSSTTALLRLFSQHPDVHCVYQPVKTGLRASGTPDYGLYHGRHPVYAEHPGFVVSKETVGHSSAAECTFDPLADDETIRRVRPLFVFRDPARTWSSWKRLRWGDIELFVAAYRHVHDLMTRAHAISPHARALSAESLALHKPAALRGICANWGLRFDPALLGDFDVPLFESRRLHMDEAARRYSRSQGSHDDLGASRTFGMPTAHPDLTAPGERRRIEQELVPLYRSVLAGEGWIGEVEAAPLEGLA